MEKLFLILLIFSITNIKILAQLDSTEVLDSKIFELIEDYSENNEDVQLNEIIEQFISNPIDINEASIDDLLELPFLTLQEANAILNGRKKLQQFKSFEELKTIKGIHPDLLLLLKPFFVFIPLEVDKREKQIASKTQINLRSRIVNDLQERKGFFDEKYLGDKLKTYNRIRFVNSNFNSGLLIEKDAGEKSFLDYYSCYISYKGNNLLKNIFIGDFNFEFGQGLVMWSPYSFSKGSNAISSAIKNGREIIPHNSSEENRFLRGGGITSQIDNFKLSAFYSVNKKDATLNDNETISNFSISGYHRTDSEYSHLDLLTENAFGASLNYSTGNLLNIGLLYVQNNFDKELKFGNEFSLNGNKFSFTSLSYNFSFNQIQIAGEVANNGTVTALVSNLYIGLTNSIQFVTSFRNYPKNYFNIYSNGFGESNNTQNETGYYFGLKINSDVGLFNIYYDIFQFPFSNYTNGFASTGNDFLINYESYISNGLKATIKFKDEIKESIYLENSKKIIGNSEKLNLRFNLDYKISKSIFGRTRIESVQYSDLQNSEEGYLLFQDLKYKFANISVVGRIIFFQTESYNSRVYEFENDLRGTMSNLPLFGEGFRWYFLFNFEVNNNFHVYLKYSETYKPNLKSLSSGNSEIIGNSDNRISTQIDISF